MTATAPAALPGHHESPNSDVYLIDIARIRGSFSPRVEGEDPDHVMRLAEADVPFPPILVDPESMCVIDGMHRLRAATINNQTRIAVRFFGGPSHDAFLAAIRENAHHGMPLSRDDQTHAIGQILATHGYMSDRAISLATGLPTRKIAQARRSIPNLANDQQRMGRDGRVRPLDATVARQHAADLLRRDPHQSLRQVARVTGLSPATVLDVRRRINRGDIPTVGSPPSPQRRLDSDQPRRRPSEHTIPTANSQPAAELSTATSVEQLARLTKDPSIQGLAPCRALVRCMQLTTVCETRLPKILFSLPVHRLPLVAELATHYASMWKQVAESAQQRAERADLQ